MDPGNNFYIHFSKEVIKGNECGKETHKIFSVNTGYISLGYNESYHIFEIGDKEITILYSGFNNLDDEGLLSTIIRGYGKNGFNPASILAGEFVLIIIDTQKEKISFFIDHINSRKVFYTTDNSSYFFAASRISLIKGIKGKKFNYAGLTSWLVNGAFYDGMTLYEDLHVIPYASCLSVNFDFKISCNSYWKFYFPEIQNDKKIEDLVTDFREIVIESVKKRIAGKNKIIVPLTGGWDSRLILSVLKKLNTSSDKVLCITVNHYKTVQEGSDVYTARVVAEKAGYKHLILPGFPEDINEFSTRNAEVGDSYAHLEKEITAWDNFTREWAYDDDSVILPGDRFSLRRVENESIERILDKIYIYDLSRMKSCLNIFDTGLSDRMIHDYNCWYSGLISRYSCRKVDTDLRHILYFEQRVQYILSTNRIEYMGKIAPVTFPLLDFEILNFIMKLPVELRHNSSFYLSAIKPLYPDLFEIPRNTKATVFIDTDRIVLEGIRNNTLQFNSLNEAFGNINIRKNLKIKNYKSKTESLKKVLKKMTVLRDLLPFTNQLTSKLTYGINNKSDGIITRLLILDKYLQLRN